MCATLLPQSCTKLQLPKKAIALTGIETYLPHVHIPSQDVLLMKYTIYKDWGSSELVFPNVCFNLK